MTFYALNQNFYKHFYYVKSVVSAGIDSQSSPRDLQVWVDNMNQLIELRGLGEWNLNFQPNQAEQSKEFNQLLDSVPSVQRSTDASVLSRKYAGIPFRAEKFYCQNQVLLGILARDLVNEDPAGYLVWHRIVRNITVSMSRKMDEEERSLVATSIACLGLELIGASRLIEASVILLLGRQKAIAPKLWIFAGCTLASNLLFCKTRMNITDHRREVNWL